jgi:hypothetical protein
VRRLTALSLWCVLLCPAGSRAEVLYSQPFFLSSARISDYGTTDATGFRMYDDFTLASDARVERVTFLGLWLGPAGSDLAAPSPDPSSWEFGFFADAAGQPGASLSVQTVTPAAVSTTYLGNTTFNFGNGDLRQVNIYSMAATLPSAFLATGGTKYWFSPFTLSPTLLPAFSWLGDNPNAPVGDSRSIQRVIGPGGAVTQTIEVGQDRGLLLEGSTVPEPATMALVGVGAAFLLARRRRRA